MAADVAVIGRGVVGGRIIQRLALVTPDVHVIDLDPRRGRIDPARYSVAVLAQPGPHVDLATELLNRGVPVVSVGEGLDDTRALLDLDDLARAAGVPLVVGAGMSPGLTGLLARHLADQLTGCDEIHIAVHGTAGPSCARQHHRALSGQAVGLHDGEWIRRPAGSGRELCWFPEPVGAYDCYRAELASPIVLHHVFPEVTRLSERMSANRRDRFTARLPMLRPPHVEGGVGAVRVEVRGSDENGGRRTLVVGIAELVGTAAAATATAFAGAAVRDELDAGVVCAGDQRLDTAGLLRTIGHLGVRLQEFTGVPSIRRIAA
jgi:hypothetical protein